MERSHILFVFLDTRDSHRVHSRVDLFLQDSVLELRGPLGGSMLHETRRLEEPGRSPPQLEAARTLVSRLHALSLLTGASLPAASEPKATESRKAWSIVLTGYFC